MIKPKTTGFRYWGRHCSAEGIGPNVGRASKGGFPRAKGKCDQGGITPPPHHYSDQILLFVLIIIYMNTVEKNQSSETTTKPSIPLTLCANHSTEALS